MMTLEAFTATGRDMTNAAGEVTARTYVEVLFIEHWIDGRAGIAPPGGVPTWLLTTDGPEQETGDIETLEIKLYAWAVVNGYCDDDTAPDIAAMTFFIAAASNADGVHWSSVIWGGDDSYDNVKAGAELEAGIALGKLEVAVTLHGPFIAGPPLPA